jgi:syntaxin 16
MCKNVQASLAQKVQELTIQFRKTQSNYLNKLRGREGRKHQFSEDAADQMIPVDLVSTLKVLAYIRDFQINQRH